METGLELIRVGFWNSRCASLPSEKPQTGTQVTVVSLDDCICLIVQNTEWTAIIPQSIKRQSRRAHHETFGVQNGILRYLFSSPDLPCLGCGNWDVSIRLQARRMVSSFITADHHHHHCHQLKPSRGSMNWDLQVSKNLYPNTGWAIVPMVGHNPVARKSPFHRGK